MKVNKFGKKIVTCIAVAGLIFASNSAMVSAAKKVTLKPTMLYANTDKIKCRQVSANGKVYADSKRSVSWVLI